MSFSRANQVNTSTRMSIEERRNKGKLQMQKSKTYYRGSEPDERVEDERSGPSSNPNSLKPWQGKDRLSKKFDARKTSNPFGAPKKHKTNFSYIYSSGGIPCRINHGGVISRLQWDTKPEQLSYDPLLITVSEGLAEVQHPFVFVARTAFKELLEAPKGSEKTVPLVPQIVRNLRAALLTKNDDIFIAALTAIMQLSNAVGSLLDSHLSAILIQISKKSFQPKFKTVINETLLTLAENGGNNVAKLIKAKIPTFSCF